MISESDAGAIDLIPPVDHELQCATQTAIDTFLAAIEYTEHFNIEAASREQLQAYFKCCGLLRAYATRYRLSVIAAIENTSLLLKLEDENAWLKENALFSCQNEGCAENCSYPLNMLREYQGKPICKYCYEDDAESVWTDLPPLSLTKSSAKAVKS